MRRNSCINSNQNKIKVLFHLVCRGHDQIPCYKASWNTSLKYLAQKVERFWLMSNFLKWALQLQLDRDLISFILDNMSQYHLICLLWSIGNFLIAEFILNWRFYCRYLNQSQEELAAAVKTVVSAAWLFSTALTFLLTEDVFYDFAVHTVAQNTWLRWTIESISSGHPELLWGHCATSEPQWTAEATGEVIVTSADRAVRSTTAEASKGAPLCISTISLS